MFDAEKLLRNLTRGGLSKGGMVKGGGMMLLGGLAYAAFEHFSQQQGRTAQAPAGQPPMPFAPGTGNATQPPPMAPHTPPPLPGSANPGAAATPPPLPQGAGTAPVSHAAPMPAEPQATPQAMPGPEQERAVLMIRAMIAAAKADGEIDADERAAILARLDEEGSGAEAHAFIEAEMARPLDLYEITSNVRDAAMAADVYAASLLAITVDTDAERRYLDRLAARLGLDDGAAEAIEARLANVDPDRA